MKDWQSQAHVKWECKYHVVILPKYRKKKLFGRTRRAIGKILRELCRQKDVELLEGKSMPDPIHMLLSVPPKYSIAMTMGYLKGKSAIRIHREVLRTKGTLFGREFWARGYPRPTWTRELLVKVMQRLTAVRVHPTTMGRALKRIGARLGRPRPTVGCPWPKRRRQRRIREIRRVLEARADHQVAVYLDEVDIHLNPKIGPDWMNRGKQKEVITPGQNVKRYLCGALDAATGRMTWVKSTRKDSLLFIQMLNRLVEAYRQVASDDRQMCIPHLPRELLKVDERNDGIEWKAFSKQLKRLLRDALRLAKRPDFSKDRYASRIGLMNQRLWALADAIRHDADARRLAQRIGNCRDYLFTFLDTPGVPPDNNHAERMIRPAVVIRKNSLCNRSERGAATAAVLMSIYRTLKLRGHDPTRTIAEALKTYLANGTLPQLPAEYVADG